MISYLNIKNIAIISELELSFERGLNVLSGETGAGKSILIDSVNFVLGDRADRSLIRYGENMARVEAYFTEIKNFSEVKSILEEAGIDCEEDGVIVTRTMTADKSECRINRKIVPLSLLKSVVALLVDTHTQNENQTLLKVANHLKIIDRYASGVQDLLSKYRETLYSFRKICDKINDFSDKQQREREIDVLNYQIAEIEKTSVREGEEEELKAKRSLFYNSQKISGALQTSYNQISGSTGFGALPAIETARSEISRILQYDASLGSILERLNSCDIELNDIQETLYEKLSDTGENLDIDQIEKRLEEIRMISKKYGKTAADIQTFYQKASERLESLLHAEVELEKLYAEKEKTEKSLRKAADALHAVRADASRTFCDKIGKNIVELGMKNAKFEVKFDKISEKCEDYNENGYDVVEFMMAPNLGEPLKPLAKIASGGEMSRFMLALKNVIAEIDNVDTLIFDEIDTGISGVIAQVVAEKMYDIAVSRQVIAITHLPQLGSMADANYLIAKNDIAGKTLTSVQRLEGEAVYRELMRLSGAIENSEVGRNNAIELKNRANLYKKAK